MVLDLTSNLGSTLCPYFAKSLRGKGLPQDVIQHIKPIIIDLSRDELLSKCLHGMTQNANESFNGTIWNRVPKQTYVGLRQLEIGVYDAIANFNIGRKASVLIYEKLGIRPGTNMLRGCNKNNNKRIYFAKRQSCVKQRNIRRVRRSKKTKVAETLKNVEGDTYGAGKF